MTWFKVTDTLMTDEKVMMMPLHSRGMALGTWVACGTWSAQHLTDGKIPRGVVETFVGTLDGAETLVEARMWKRTRAGFAFNKWDKYQFTREEVETKREQERARKAEFRERQKSKPQVKPGNVPVGHRPDSAGTNAVSDPPVPTRPDPSRPVPSSGSSNEGDSPKQRASSNEPPVQPCGSRHDAARPCGGCKRANERADELAQKERMAKRSAEAKAKARATHEAIQGCDRCDDKGYLESGRVCHHFDYAKEDEK